MMMKLILKLFLILIIFSCDPPVRDSPREFKNPDGRIKKVYRDGAFWIIDVDGHQYLIDAGRESGIIHLESCPHPKCIK